MKIFAANALLGENLDHAENVLITIEKGLVADISVGSDSAGAEVVLAPDRFLMPAMIDSHSHLALDARIPGHLFLMDDPETVQSIRALKSLKDNLHAGITSIRSLGDRYYLDIILRDMIDQGELEGPKLEVSAIGMKGLHGHGYVGKGFSGVEELRRQSRENLYRGADWLKMFITGGAPPRGGLTPAFLNSSEIQCIIEEAHQVGKRVTAHCIGGKALQDACRSEIDCLEHLYWVSKEDIDTIMASDTLVCYTPGVYMDDTRLPMCPQSHVDNVRRFREGVAERLSDLIQAGPRFIIGSDAYHGELWREIEFMVSLGMERTEAVKGITVYPGRLRTARNPVGWISQGCIADLIAVEGNPLVEEAVLQHVCLVIQDGKMIRSEQA